MQLTPESFAELEKKATDLQKKKELASELLKTAQDRHSQTTHLVTRDGKEVELTEQVLWQEVFHLGVECDAAKILRGIYPDVFSAYASIDKASEELKAFTLHTLGFSFTEMSPFELIGLIRGIVQIEVTNQLNTKTKFKQFLWSILK